MRALRIVDWSKHFENNRTRELKSLDWVPVPNKHDGDGYTELVVHRDGMAHYGAWLLIVQVASKCDPRGTLLRDGSRPHDSASLARKTRGDQKIFDQSIPRLVEIGWLEWVDCGTSTYEETAAKCENPAAKCDETATGCLEGKGREGKGTEGNGDLFLVHDFEFPQHLRTPAFMAKWEAWVALRKTMKKSKDWVRLFQSQIEMLGGFPEATAISILNKSITNEYQGLIIPDSFQPGRNTKPGKAVPNI